jgi:hypothetical protein
LAVLRALCVVAVAGGFLAAAADAMANPIVVIVMENRPYASIVGSANAPFINHTMIANGTLATAYTANAAGSARDYFAMTSGLTDPTTAVRSDNVFNRLQASSTSWAEYEESMPSPCYKGGTYGTVPGGTDPLYTNVHDPAVRYKDIRGNAAVCKAHVLPYASPYFDASALPAFALLVPNECNDMHSYCGTNQTQAGDQWLAANVPPLVANGATVILTFDEGTKKNERVATVTYSATTSSGRDATAYTHFSLLAGLEDRFGQPRLNGALGVAAYPIP